MLPFQDQTPSSSSPLVENNPAEQEKEELKPYQRKSKQGLNKFLPGCRRMLET
jgi:hypothetical protein